MKEYKQEPYTVPLWIYNAIQVLRPVERLTVSEWAAKYRTLSGGAIPGPWNNDITPYLVEVMDAFTDDIIEEIVFVKPTQVGGTTAMETRLCPSMRQSLPMVRKCCWISSRRTTT